MKKNKKKTRNSRNSHDRIEESLSQSELELKIKNKIAEIFLTTLDDEIYRKVLLVILEVFESENGFFGYINQDNESLVVPFTTGLIWDQCRTSKKEIVFHKNKWSGLWGKTLKEKKLFCSNETIDVPKEHVPLARAMFAPVIYHNELIGSIGIGNKAINYEKKDKELLETFANYIAPILNTRLLREKQDKERMLAEETLRRQTEEQLRKLSRAVEQSPATIMITDTKGHIEYVNPKFTELTGYSTEEVLGQNVNILKSEEHPPAYFKELWNTINSGKVWGGEFLNKKKNGDLYWENASISPITNQDGDITHFVSVKEDITERKRMDKELTEYRHHLEDLVKERTAELRKTNERLVNEITEHKQTSEQLRKLFRAVEQSPVSIIITDMESNIEYVNPKFIQVTRYSPDEILGKNSRILKSGKHSQEFYDELWSTINSGNIWRGELQNKKKSGETYWESASISPVTNIEGVVTHFIGIMEDITDRKRADMELERYRQHLEELVKERTSDLTKAIEDLRQENVERQRVEKDLWQEKNFSESLLQTAQAIVLVLDMEGRIKYFNPYMEEISGYRLNDVQGKDWFSTFLPKRNHLYTKKLFSRAINDIKTRGNVNPIVTKDGCERMIEWYDKTLKDTDANIVGLVTVGQDITERKRAEEKLKNSREELRNLSIHLQSAIEEERTWIAREIHDELGQILTALQNDLSYISLKFPDNKKQLIKKTKEMSELIDTCIQTVQKISSDLRPNLLDKLGIIPAMKRHAKEFQMHTKIKCLVTYNTEDITLDKHSSTMVFRIFQESLTNIARHANATIANVILTKAAGSLILEVRDNGKGILPSEISSPKSFGIIGMRERVRFVGGMLKIVSANGTTLTVKIPLLKKENPNPNEPEPKKY